MYSAKPPAEIGWSISIWVQAVRLNLILAGRVVVMVSAIPTLAAVDFDSDRHSITKFQQLAVVVHDAGSIIADLDNGADNFVTADIGIDRLASQLGRFTFVDMAVPYHRSPTFRRVESRNHGSIDG